MDAHEVNIKIAEALGYGQVITRSAELDVIHFWAKGKQDFYSRLRPGLSETEIYEEMVGRHLPNWSTDIAAAIELLGDTCRWWEAVYFPEEYIVKVGLSSSPGQSYMAANTSLAMAICMAWLRAKVNENPYGAKAE